MQIGSFLDLRGGGARGDPIEAAAGHRPQGDCHQHHLPGNHREAKKTDIERVRKAARR